MHTWGLERILRGATMVEQENFQKFGVLDCQKSGVYILLYYLLKIIEEL